MFASMTIGQFLLFALLGIVTVFIVLAFLMLVIKLISLIPDKKAKAETTSSAAEKPAVPAVLAPGSAGDLALYDTDPRDAAMIMAIVADELGKPLNELRFISIREVQQ